MGFTLTPRGFHTLGSQNHCLMFGSDYVELLAVPRPHPAMQYYTDFLAKGEGLGAIALATDDAHGAARRASPRTASWRTRRSISRGRCKAWATRAFASCSCRPMCRRAAACSPASTSRAMSCGGRNTSAMRTAPRRSRPSRWSPKIPRRPRRATASCWRRSRRRSKKACWCRRGSAPIALASRWKLGHRLHGVGLPLRPRPLVAALSSALRIARAAAGVLRTERLNPVALADGSFAVSAQDAHGVAVVFG